MKKRLRLGLFHKFALVMIVSGLIPMILLATVMMRAMLNSHRDAVTANYEQAAAYVGNRLESMLDSYNNITKMPYYYNFSAASPQSGGSAQLKYLTFDTFRQIFYGIGYDPEEMEERRKEDMESFLRNLINTDSYITGAHFIGEDLNGKMLAFHVNSFGGSGVRDEEAFLGAAGEQTADRSSRKMMLSGIHRDDYFYGIGAGEVFTVARNYFDLRGSVGDMNYVGTLYLDVDANRIRDLVDSVDFASGERLYLLRGDGSCFYSNQPEAIGRRVAFEAEQGAVAEQDVMAEQDAIEARNVTAQGDTAAQPSEGGQDAGAAGASEALILPDNADTLLLRAEGVDYPITTVVAMDADRAFDAVTRLYALVWGVLGVSVLALILAAVFFSRRLTRPLNELMGEMEKVETGDFDIHLREDGSDEISVLSSRFNRMSAALKEYIDKSYLAQIRQNEAELTALKSQIYPHFLYNTLEIIRMTALENRDTQVSGMIEALSEQIHYLIGPVQDRVPLAREVEIVRKYVFLLNCRIQGSLQLTVTGENLADYLVPKLILQPIVENAWVHGIKPKGGRGKISIDVREQGGRLEIGVMDNGAGMDREQLARMEALLAGDEMGVRDEYNWKSIGMKNVNDRIRHLYGADYGIRVTSAPGFGTVVKLLLPVEKAGDGLEG